MSVVLELDRAPASAGHELGVRGHRPDRVAISGWGMAVDHVVSDFVAGAADRLVREGAARGGPAVAGGPGLAAAPGVLRGHPRPAARLVGRRAGPVPPRRAHRIADYPGTRCRRWPRSCAATRRRPPGCGPRRSAAIALNTARTGRRGRARRDRAGGRPRPACRPTTSCASAPSGCWTRCSPHCDRVGRGQSTVTWLNGSCGSTHGKTTNSSSAATASARTTASRALVRVPPGSRRQIQAYSRDSSQLSASAGGPSGASALLTGAAVQTRVDDHPLPRREPRVTGGQGQEAPRWVRRPARGRAPAR